MIDYQTYLQIHHLHQHEKLNQAQIANKLGLDPSTISKWLSRPRFEPRKPTTPRPSKLDPFKPQIHRWLEAHAFSGTQILQRLRDIGYDGGKTILNDYLRHVRPQRPPTTYLKLHFDPGQCAQVDWGECGTLTIGKTKRKLQVFVMVLCYSRLLYLRFYLSQSLECFLDAHVRAFTYFNGVPRRIMIDNLKTGVIDHRPGQLPNYHPRYLDLARHYGFAPIACNVGQGHEKGRVERGVGYIKDNFLSGRPINDLASLQAAGEHWRDQIANQRQHGTTQQIPQQHFQAKEKATLIMPHPERYDCSVTKQAYRYKDSRIRFETNTYSIPPSTVGKQLMLKIEADRLRIYDDLKTEPIATHPRSYDKHQDIEDPSHTAQLKDQRRQALEQNLTHDFRKLGPLATGYFEQLKNKHLDYRDQIRRLLALRDIHGEEALQRALQDSLEQEAIHAAYIENLLAARARMTPVASPLHLTRHEDQLELPSPQPDLEIYSKPHHPK